MRTDATPVRLFGLGRPVLALSLLLLMGAIALSTVGPLIQIGQGCGYDGSNYCQVIEAWGNGEWNLSDGYLVQRLFPSAMVALRLLFDEQVERHNIVLVFTQWNILLLIVGFFVALHLSRFWRLSSGLEVVWLSALFLNFAHFSHAYFYPVLTDVSAFCLSLGMLYCWHLERRRMLVGLCLLSWFTWPIAWVYGAILIGFPKEDKPVPGPSSARWNDLAAVFACLLTSGLMFVYWGMGASDAYFSGVVKPSYPLLGFAVVLAFLLFVGTPLVRTFPGIFNKSTGFRVKAVVLYLGTYFLFRWTMAQYTVFEMPMSHLFLSLSQLSVTFPGVFLTAHFMYFGPILLFAFWGYERGVSQIARWGPAPILILGFTFLLWLGGESRQQVFGFPWVVLCLVHGLAGVWPRQRLDVWLFVLVSGLLARPGILDPFRVYKQHRIGHFDWGAFAPWWDKEEWVIFSLVGLGLCVCIAVRFSTRFRRSLEECATH